MDNLEEEQCQKQEIEHGPACCLLGLASSRSERRIDRCLIRDHHVVLACYNRPRGRKACQHSKGSAQGARSLQGGPQQQQQQRA